MFAALYGELTPHPWRDQDSGTDAYSLFHDRSQAMGWLHDIHTATRKTVTGRETRQAGAAGLWTMNDAGQEHLYPDPGLPLAVWFQVGMEPVPTERPLPVQPFLRCAGDAAARIGTLQLQAVQLLLPVDGLDAASRPEPDLMPSLENAEWFGDRDPQSATSVQLRLDSGNVSSIRSAAPHMRKQLTRLEQDVFVCESYSLAEQDSLPVQPPFADRFWNGPPRHQASFHGTLAEWSLDALGWLGGLLADLSAWSGVTTPLLLTASRAGETGSG
ncbi:hypothetical protein [Actinopolyspora mortivallis]|uniref:Uncharacterized protein n=1 Tax=Actinopolyspora mortivallis TaxID=33906 RepID=A0A2T0GX27_ACTMO|nr:hypothetical protein [Actinopolyspora mortivallis]PRW63654.1 hypothetical protein CEP50_09325 [Actinopolyspora mortivallis]